MNYGIELHLSPELLPVMMVGDPFSVCRYAQARYSRMWVLSQVGLQKPKVLWRTYLLRRLRKPFAQFPFECWIRRKLKVINMRYAKSLYHAVSCAPCVCIPAHSMGAPTAIDRTSSIPLVHRFDPVITPNLPSPGAGGLHGCVRLWHRSVLSESVKRLT